MHGAAFPCGDFPDSFVARHQALFACRRYTRGQGEPEYRFHYHERFPCLPVWHEGQLLLARWGNGTGLSAALPRCGWTWEESLTEKWAQMERVEVVIPARLGFMNGVWYPIFEGVQGLFVMDEQDRPVVYVVVRAATHYYQVMTRAMWMPVLVNQTI
jgi:hypothetical protein